MDLQHYYLTLRDDSGRAYVRPFQFRANVPAATCLQLAVTQIPATHSFIHDARTRSEAESFAREYREDHPSE